MIWKSKIKVLILRVVEKKDDKKAAIAQLVEHQLPKLRVASSSLVCRSNKVVYTSVPRV